MQDVVEELRAAGALSVAYCPADVRRGRRSRAAARSTSTARFARLDALVNNAGRAPRVRADLLEATEESFDELIRINLQGPYFLTQQVARMLMARAGARPRRAFAAAIVFVTSVSAELASPNRGDYCVSKAGLAMAAQLYALRLAAHGIPVLRGPPRHHRHRHDRRRSRDVYDQRIADGLVPEATLGAARRRRQGGRRAAARRPAVRDRVSDSRRGRIADWTPVRRRYRVRPARIRRLSGTITHHPAI